ncbi:MAG: glutamate--tRNA ligase [Rickettsiaceae bacterium]|nr:glutamate--tRNA ligase [Rickettsiaceae bacterium]
MIVTRFAPSPTGYLHIGGARTALFNYLFAKKHNGKFLLRVEDTDKKRSTTDAIDAIFTSLKWLDIQWDDEVVYQSKQEQRHKEVALELVEKGLAYYCFTPQEEIITAREKALAAKQHFIFKSKWRDTDPKDYPQNIKPVVRLKAPETGQTIVKDQLQGNVVIENSHLDDMILLRSDGTPTYMLAVVVDDHDMGVTHIIRGDDHLNNASRQQLLYQALNWQIPEMVHIPLIHGTDGAKLSKRHGALGAEHYKDMGYLPEALCNYLLRLGWSHGDDEVILREQAIKWFDIKGLGKSPSRLDFAKMENLNSIYLRNMDNEKLSKMVVDNIDIKLSKQSQDCIKAGIDSLKPRVKLLNELYDLAKIYIIDQDITISDEALDIIKKTDTNIINQVINAIKNETKLEQESLKELLKNIAKDNDLKLGVLMQPIRALITGMVNSPSVFEIITIIGKEQSLERLQQINSLK